MPVQKFRDLDSARRALWSKTEDSALARRITSLWECSREMSGYASPRGVQKFRSLEEANLDRAERTRQRMAKRARQLGLLNKALSSGTSE